MDPDIAPRAIVAGHGNLPAGLVSAVHQITGRGGALIPFSNTGLGREEIEAKFRELLALHHVRVIFTDLPGGSATLAARRVLRDMTDLVIITGAGLPMLMDFVFCDPALTAVEAAARAAEKGRDAIIGISN
jgi:mannose/fructose-specific phosphotransferase system component IIA